MLPKAVQRVVDEIQAGIAADTFNPGKRLPPREELAERFDVSPMTIRTALDWLAAIGVVKTQHRGGTVVCEQPPRMIVDADGTSISPTKPVDLLDEIPAATGAEQHVETQYEIVKASREIAKLLGVRTGTRLLARNYRVRVNDCPVQLATSYLPAARVEGTRLADPLYEPWPDATRSQLATLGVRVDRTDVTVSTSLPTPEEAEALEIGEAVPVLRFTRIYRDAEGKPVAVDHPIVRRGGDTTTIKFSRTYRPAKAPGKP